MRQSHHLALTAALLVTAACGSSTLPVVLESDYTLVSVDGAKLPVPYTGSGFRTSQEIANGQLALFQKDTSSSPYDSAQRILNIVDTVAAQNNLQGIYYRVTQSGSTLILRPTSGALPADTGTISGVQITIRTHLAASAPTQSFLYEPSALIRGERVKP